MTQFSLDNYTMQFTASSSPTPPNKQQHVLLRLNGADGEKVEMYFQSDGDGTVVEVSESEFTAYLPLDQFSAFQSMLATLKAAGDVSVKIGTVGGVSSVTVSGQPL